MSGSAEAHLPDGVGGREVLGADGDARGVGLELGGQLLDGGRPGRGEHERLAVGARRAGYRADVRLKAQVQHAVGLIQHQVCYPRQPACKCAAYSLPTQCAPVPPDYTPRSGYKHLPLTLHWGDPMAAEGPHGQCVMPL